MEKFIMHLNPRRAHLILIGQTLLVEWTERCRLYAKGDKLYAEGDKLRAESCKLYAEASNLLGEGDKLWGEGRNFFLKIRQPPRYTLFPHTAGVRSWEAAVKAEGCTMRWSNRSTTCTLSNGEVY